MVFVERGRLSQAYGCLKFVYRLAPREDYIVKHLRIIKARLQKLQHEPHNSAALITAFTGVDPREYGDYTAAALRTKLATDDLDDLLGDFDDPSSGIS